MGFPASVLLGGEGGPARPGCAGLHRASGSGILPIRDGVPGQHPTFGHHAPHGQVLHHAHWRHEPPVGRRPAGPCRHGQDGDNEGPCQGPCEAVCGLQLLRRSRLPRYGQVLQGPRVVRRVGVLRRVQPHRPRRALRGRLPGGVRARRPEGAQGLVRLRRRPGGQSAPGVLLLHHDEPWLRRQAGAAREPQGALPRGVHDGSRLYAHYACEARRVRLLREPGHRQEV
mmetsp:Transcript_60195/g.148044  ORF Transcript_60195/g.148044 Transcript_60195/m.148044 type:complete len:227 (+) Transcript_60195:141-821(+)